MRTSVVLALSLMSVGASAADIGAGQQKSAMCAACHGVKGVSASPVFPNLAGQQSLYLEKQLKAFRDGERNDPTMSSIAKILSDKDIANLAAYFSSLQ